MPYFPKQGDIIRIEAPAPSPSREASPGGMAHAYPAVVVSNDSYSRYTRLAVVCPVAEEAEAFPMHVPLDRRTVTAGVVRCQRLALVDLNVQNVAFTEKLPPDLLREVMERVILSFE